MVIDKGNAKSSLKIVIVIVFLSSETYRKSNVTFKDGMIDHEHFFVMTAVWRLDIFRTLF